MECKIKIITISIFIIFLLPQNLFSSAIHEQSNPDEEVKPVISWNFLCKDITGNIKVLQYNNIFEINPRAHYSIEFKVMKSIYVYIFLYDTNENIRLLFPDIMTSPWNRLDTGNIYTIKGKHGHWLSLEPGTHIRNLYILATGSRQKRLDKLIKQYLSSFNSKNLNTNQKEAVKNLLLQEIIRINRRNNDYVVYAEKPNDFMGDVQNDEKQKELEWIMEKNMPE